MVSHIGPFLTENDAGRDALDAFHWSFGLIAFEGLLAHAVWRFT